LLFWTPLHSLADEAAQYSTKLHWRLRRRSTPERILNAALEADLAALVVVGYDKNGQYYFHSSIPHGSTVNWLLDQCKKRIIDEPSDMRGEPGTEEQTDDR
jgi:hypothetical protein